MRRAFAHPYTPCLAQLLLVPAFLLAQGTDGGSWTLALVPGLLFVWTAFALATNRNQAFSRLTDSQAREAKIWMLLTGSIGRGDPPEPPKTKADELNASIPTAMLIGAWGLVLTGIGVAGAASLVG